MTLHLVRHGTHDLLGRTLCGAGSVGLNAEGEREAGRVADWLAAGLQARRAVLLTSPVRRALDTAVLIGARLGLSAEVEPAIREIGFGEWEGLDFAALDPTPEWRLWNEDRGRTAPPGGESMAEVAARIGRWLERLGNAVADVAIAVSHADLIKATVAHVLGLSIHFFDRFEVGPGSVTTLRLGAGGARLLQLNQRPGQAMAHG